MNRLIPVIFCMTPICTMATPPVPASPASAASDVQQTMYLSQIYVQLKSQYDEVIKVVKEAKAASDELQSINGLTNDLIREYEFITSFSLANEIAQIERDIESVTMLDNMEGMSTLDKIKTINNEIDRRFRNMTPDERERFKKKNEQIIKLNELEIAKRREAQSASNGEMNVATLAASTASSTAIMTSLLLVQEQRIQEEELRREEDAKGRREVDGAFRQYLESNSK